MNPGIFNVAAGANVDFLRSFTALLDGAPINFTGWLGFRYQVRVQPGQTGQALIDILGDGPNLKVYPADGRIDLRIPPSMMLPHVSGNPLGFRRLYHELVGTQSDGRRDKFFQGNFDLFPGVAR